MRQYLLANILKLGQKKGPAGLSAGPAGLGGGRFKLCYVGKCGPISCRASRAARRRATCVTFETGTATYQSEVGAAGA